MQIYIYIYKVYARKCHTTHFVIDEYIFQSHTEPWRTDKFLTSKPRVNPAVNQVRHYEIRPSLDSMGSEDICILKLVDISKKYMPTVTKLYISTGKQNYALDLWNAKWWTFSSHEIWDKTSTDHIIGSNKQIQWSNSIANVSIVHTNKIQYYSKLFLVS